MNTSNSRQYLLLGISDGSIIQYKFDYSDIILSHDHIYHEELDPQVLEYLECEDNIIYVDSFDQIKGNTTQNIDEKEDDNNDVNDENDDNNINSDGNEAINNDNNNNNNNKQNNMNNETIDNNLNELQFTHGHYYKANIHDNKYGNITGIVLSYDDSYMISCGSDGAIFVYRNKNEKILNDDGNYYNNVKICFTV